MTNTFRLDTKETFLILGGGIAAVSAALAIRERNSTAEIFLSEEENSLPYSRPMMTKTAFRGFSPTNYDLYDEDFYKRQRITVKTNCAVTSIDAQKKQVALSDGSTMNYDKCIYALGAECFVPPINGSDKENVITVRRKSDIEKIRRMLLKSKKAVVIGGGVIGLEISWELKKAGLEVVVIELANVLMERLLDEETARFLEKQILKTGIEVVTGAKITGITGDEKAKGVLLDDGNEYDGDFIILSTGIKANTQIAKDAKIEVARAVIVNERMETNLSDIYACGDCAEYNGNNYGTWGQAQEQGEVAGANAAGDNLHYVIVPSPIMMNGAGSNLFSIGDMGKNPDSEYEVLRYENKQGKNIPLVNPRHDIDDNMETYYFAGGKIVGAALVGDLSKRKKVSDAIDNGQSLEKFKSGVAE